MGRGSRKPSLGEEKSREWKPWKFRDIRAMDFGFPWAVVTQGAGISPRVWRVDAQGARRCSIVWTGPVQLCCLGTGMGMSQPGSFPAFRDHSLSFATPEAAILSSFPPKMGFLCSPTVFGLQISHHLIGSVSLYPRRKALTS